MTTLAVMSRGIVRRALQIQQELTAAAVAAVLLAVLLFGWLPVSLRSLGDFRPDCTVRADGSQLSVELTGWRAGAACRAMVSNIKGVSEGQSSGAVICTGAVNGVTETVRDNPQLPLLGVLVCSGIHAHKPSAATKGGTL